MAPPTRSSDMNNLNPDQDNVRKRPSVLHLVLIYAIFAALWILLSDSVLSWWTTDPDQIAHISTLKGLAFVSVTSLLLYGLLRRAAAQARLSAERENLLQAEKLHALHLLESIAESSTDAIFAKDAQGRYVLFNKASERNVGKPAVQVLGKSDTALFPPEEAEMVMADDRRIMAESCVRTWEHTLNTSHGARVFLTTQGPLFDTNGRINGVFGIARDITERKLAEEQLTKLSLAVEQSPENIMITDLNAHIEYVNQSFVTNTGYSREEVAGKDPRMLQSGKTPRANYDALWKSLDSGQSWQGELYNRRKDGSEYVEHAIISPVRQPDGRITHYMAIKQDITQMKLAEAEINRLAFYDPLTGLPNRARLLERGKLALAVTHREQQQSALLLFNIDRFKNINDAGGQMLGDEVLKAVAERLGHLLREGDMVARLSGDEFAILLPNLAPQKPDAAHHALHIVEKILARLREPIQLDGQTITLTACMGIALFPENEQDTMHDILRRCDTALHHAKSKGTAQVTFFDDSLEKIVKQRFSIEQELRRAISINELNLYLQPQVEANGKMVGAEVLVRWQHPVRGLLLPGTFIPLAEESDLIVGIGEWVFAETCRLLVHPDVACCPLRISVNISPRHFRQADFVAWIKRMLAASGADPARLTLEITEGLVIDNFNEVVAKMLELTELGIHFSMDDFGTGYSSLAYLKRLPLHELKIDKTFVQDAPTDPNDAALVETILAVASHLHLKVVAEGVETQEQADFLNARANVIHQGYLYGKPEPVETWLEHLRRRGGFSLSNRPTARPHRLDG